MEDGTGFLMGLQLLPGPHIALSDAGGTTERGYRVVAEVAQVVPQPCGARFGSEWKQREEFGWVACGVDASIATQARPLINSIIAIVLHRAA